MGKSKSEPVAARTVASAAAVAAPPAVHPVLCMCIDCVAFRQSGELVIYQSDAAATAGILIDGHPNNCVCVDCAAAANAGISLQR